MIERGHPEAWHYPLFMVADEADLIVQRDNRRIASEAIALRSAMLTAWPGGEEANKLFTDLLGRLNGD